MLFRKENVSITVGNAGFIIVDGYTGMFFTAIAGENLTKGNLVSWSQASDNRIIKTPSGGQMPIGIIAKDVLSGKSAIVICAGYAWVKFKSGVTGTYGYVAFQSSGGGGVAGEADCSSSVPTTDHWAEIGHVAKTGTSGGLALCTLHFN